MYFRLLRKRLLIFKMGGSQSAESVKEHLQGKPVVVVIGAGAAGSYVATYLESVANIILIDRRSYGYHNVAAPRATVDSIVEARVAIPLTQLLKYGHIIHGEVVEVHEKSLKLKDQEKPIPFDYLVIAPALATPFPVLSPSPRLRRFMRPFRRRQRQLKRRVFTTL